MIPVARGWTGADELPLNADDYPGAAGAARLPVVCLHGLTRNRLDFGDLAPRIAAMGRQVLALDMRGRGLSAWDPSADYRIPTYAGDVERLFAQLGLARALFVGTSMGGLITMELATRRPDLIAGAVVNDVGPVLDPAGLTRIAGYVGKPSRFTEWAAAEAHVRAQNAHALPHYGADDWAAMARRMFREEDGMIAPAYDPAIARPFAADTADPDLWPTWSALATGRPVLLLRGGLSDLLSAEVAARMTAGSASARLITVPGIGHAPMLDEPAALSAIHRFLAESP